MILRFPPAPKELDWLKEVPKLLEDRLEHSDDCALAIGSACDCPSSGFEEYIDGLKALYSYLRWSDAYSHTHPIEQEDEHRVAHGLLIKNYRLMRGEEPDAYEARETANAEAALKASNEEIRRRKAAKP